MSKTYTVNKIDTSRIGLSTTKSKVQTKQVKIQKEEIIIPDILDVTIGKKNKITETQYQKKLEKKALKEQVKMKEIEIEIEKERLIQEKLLAEENETKSIAQKAYDDEYTVAWIEEKTKNLAVNRSKKVYDRVYQETLDKIRKPLIQENQVTFKDVNNNSEQFIVNNTDEQLLDDSDNDDILPIIMPVTNKEPIFKISNERLIDEDTKDFKLVSYKKKSSSKFIELLEKSKKKFANEILNDKTLNDINKIFSKNNNNKSSVTVNIDVTNDNIENNITKSGFLKNTNFMFSKYLGKTIQTNLNISNIFVKIKKDDDTKYVIRFVEKK